MANDRLNISKILALTILIFCVASIFIRIGSNDFYIHDTQIVMSFASHMMLLTFSIFFLIILLAAFAKKFKNKSIIGCLLSAVLLLISSGLYIFSAVIKLMKWV